MYQIKWLYFIIYQTAMVGELTYLVPMSVSEKKTRNPTSPAQTYDLSAFPKY